MTSLPSQSNITWHPSQITSEDHERLNGHKGAVVWFTGLSGSGKSTVASALEEALYSRGIHTFILDGDNIRHGLNADLGFDADDRQENIRRISEVARLFVDAGIVVLTAFISPYRSDRDKARSLLPPGRFFEVFVDCPLEICESRDPKGLYQKARAGEIGDFTGISAPYEAPLSPEVTVNTHASTTEACVAAIVNHLEERAILTASTK